MKREPCKVEGCTEPSRIHCRGMCLPHFRTVSDGRPKCGHEDCSEIVEKSVDLYCPNHSEVRRVLSPLQSQVVDAMAGGYDAVGAVAMVTGTDRSKATTKLERMQRDPAFVRAIKDRMAAAGLTDKYLLRRLKKNIEAKKYLLSKDGDVIEVGDDARASNTALDMALKLKGAYPEKEKDANPKTLINVAIMVPPERPVDPDQPVFTIKAKQ